MRKIFLASLFLMANVFLGASIEVGKRFILTLPSTFDKAKLDSWLEKSKPAGVMLEAFHFQNKSKAKKLISNLQSKAKALGIYPLLISCDWEGGIVSRLSEVGGFVSVPAPHSLAFAGRSSSFLAGMLIGKQCCDLGINLVFAPSLDLYDKNNCVLASRCFSKNPDKTFEMGFAFAKGLLSCGVFPVIKHFPGLGKGSADTHFSSVDLNLSKTDFENNQKPFVMSLANGVDTIMCTHAVCGEFGVEPVTLSNKAVDYILSKNSNTILITDDFCMKAVRNFGPLDEIAYKSLCAGYHMIILSGSVTEQLNLISVLNQKIEQEATDEDKIAFENKINQIASFKKRIVDDEQQSVGVDENTLAVQLSNSSVSSKHQKRILLNKHCLLLTIDLPKVRASEKWFIKSNKSFLCSALESKGINCEEIILNPVSKEVEKKWSDLESRFGEFDEIVLQTFFYSDGKANDVQKKWLNNLSQYQNKITVVSLGHSLEKQVLPNASFIKVGSFQKPLLQVVADRLTKNKLKTGADILAENLGKYLECKKFGLLCHKASVVDVGNAQEFLPDFLFSWASKQKNETKLAALFSPEHGILGTKQANDYVDSVKLSQWGCPIISLHGKNKIPTPKMLKDLDFIVIDFQDVGLRCFTYLTTMKYMLEAAAKSKVAVIVLDRPNPIGFIPAGGPVLKSGFESFVGRLDVPFVTGKTIGQIALEINKKIGATLEVLSCEHLDQASVHFQEKLIAPSPNLATFKAIQVYPSTVFIEGTNYSEGRGTKYPFEQVGAPWVDGKKLATALNAVKMEGVYFESVSFTPKSINGVAENPKHKNKLCGGIFIHITDTSKYDPMKVGKEVLTELFRLYPEASEWIKWGKPYGVDLLAGSDDLRKSIDQALHKI